MKTFQLPSSTEHQKGLSHSAGASNLFESLINVTYPDSLIQFEVVDAYMRATCVAAGIPFDKEFLQKMLLTLAKRSVPEVDEHNQADSIAESLGVPAGDVRAEIFSTICDNWDLFNEDAENVAGDGFRDLLRDMPWDCLPTLLSPLFRLSDYWPEQMVRAIVGLPNDHTDDLEEMRDALNEFIRENRSESANEVRVSDDVASTSDSEGGGL